MLREVVLHGKLKDLYADPIHLDVISVAEALRGLNQIKGFRAALREGSYKVCLGEPVNENSIDENMLSFGLGSTKTIHLIPVMAGAKGGGGKMILGVAMIALAVYSGGLSVGWQAGAASAINGGEVGACAITAGQATALDAGFSISAGQLALTGASLVLGGIAQMLSPTVPQNSGGQDNFLFSRPLNTDAQGVSIPIVYGRFLTGSVVVSSGLSTVNITPPAIDPANPESEG